MQWLWAIFLKTSELPALINSRLYETNKYVKVHITYTYNEEICPHNDGFSHTTFDTLALQYSKTTR